MIQYEIGNCLSLRAVPVDPLDHVHYISPILVPLAEMWVEMLASVLRDDDVQTPII